jgi:HSP20 family molecular chaperone IbpA
VIGPEMLAKLSETLFGAGPGSHPPGTETDPSAILFDTITQEIQSDGDSATLRLTIPFTKKEEIGLKQVGLELIVTAAGQRRTIMLPPTLASYNPISATYVDGTLEVAFTRGE